VKNEPIIKQLRQLRKRRPRDPEETSGTTVKPREGIIGTEDSNESGNLHESNHY